MYSCFGSNKNKDIVNVDYIGEKTYDNSIRFGISNYDTLNPIKTNNKQMVSIDQLVFEPLVNINNSYQIERLSC